MLSELEISKRISGQLELHRNCGTQAHFLVILDGEPLIIHDSRTLTSGQILLKMSTEQTSQGFTPTEWSTVFRKIKRYFNERSRIEERSKLN